MKTIQAFLITLLAVLVFAGCGMANQGRENDNNGNQANQTRNVDNNNENISENDNGLIGGTNVNQDAQDRQGAGAHGNRQGNNNGDHNGNNNGDNNGNMQVSEEAEDKVEDLDEIDYANVIMTDNNAYVAVVLKNQPKGEVREELKKKIADQVKETDEGVQNVFVSSNPDFADRMTDYGDKIQEGKPVQGLFEEFNEMVQRIFPNQEG
ncbi:YhcN/YlaJ family sporulation lipoprotein [Bacillus lacus]|uniref:YhcN/YlaJ family sporulation lipoprotein n=1 Tax=Metabacillus lacus TaxID=1983721 RepID=A0A7X2LZG1_9BACI|nr:YhcN/YlaJ family sporulation lipoprotein [Metabacillus lacus]MRX71902.1 YhcN/YlaJ family sporulation lipoprotein [Metabacillus lacus]